MFWRVHKNIFDATFDAGLSSTSRLHELFQNIEAVTPVEFKRLGKDLVINYGFHTSPFGECLIAVTKRGICGLHFVQNEDNQSALNILKHDWPNAMVIEDSKETKRYFDMIFRSDKNLRSNLSILLKGTNFQIQVWRALLRIPEGHLTTYENIAKIVGSPRAVRAVGTAVGHNPISYLIPCHKVINKIGLLGNYRWGRERKKIIVGKELINKI